MTTSHKIGGSVPLPFPSLPQQRDPLRMSCPLQVCRSPSSCTWTNTFLEKIEADRINVSALVTSWRNKYSEANPGVDADSIGFPDPKWCLGLNGASLACGFAGNFFLLFNFTRRVRYIVALPMTILLWYFATGIVSMSCGHDHNVLLDDVIFILSSGLN